MKNFLLPVFVLCLSTQAFTQYANHVTGEVLVQLHSASSGFTLEQSVYSQIGILAQFKAKRLVSKPMNTWLYSFDEDAIAMEEILHLLYSIPEISIAQPNHIFHLSERETTPDDPFYGLQWHHNDAEDNDIDSDLAWDITTGGTTATGDEIVACIIEPNGADWSVADLIANHWMNENEIPDNGIDDDNNGYTDDFDGWDASDGDDDLPTGNHGTQVSSMIGATGNNTTGISGVNWNVKLMEVRTASTSNEAQIIEAYTYPLVMRQLYDQSNGNEGAFVVVTNASWGVDYGQPSESPLWCAMYDTLGVYGILNCGATANNNANIDNVGDLPTACPSDYMISVTATNSSDVRTSSGFGIETIDLGAPGTSVYLAGAAGNYGNATGTSFASPCVAGAIALAYSAPCESFMSIVHASPQSGADMMRQYILEGVDPVSNLADEVASGGRLNAFNTINMVLDDCISGGCVPPFDITVTQIDGTLGYIINWGITENMVSFNVRYHEEGIFTWTEVNGIFTNTFTFEETPPCSAMVVQVQAVCEDGTSEWSEEFTFPTDGCCLNPDLASIEISYLTPVSATLQWENVFASTGYTIYVTDDLGNQQVFDSATNSFEIADLDSCSVYQIQIETICEQGDPGDAEIYELNTPGCGSCEDIMYCVVSAESGTEWISNVVFGEINNATSADNGYGDYTSMSTAVDIGSVYPIELTPGFSGSSFTEYFKVWLDYNQDGEFDPVYELAFDPGVASQTTVSGSIAIPWNALAGSTRIRVAMSWLGSFGGGQEPMPCDDNGYGEAEDYCVFINTDVGIPMVKESTISLFPNPATDEINLHFAQAGTRTICIRDVLGKKILEFVCRESQTTIPVSGLSGVYHCVISDDLNTQSVLFEVN